MCAFDYKLILKNTWENWKCNYANGFVNKFFGNDASIPKSECNYFAKKNLSKTNISFPKLLINDVSFE